MWLTHFWHSWSQFFIFAWDVTAGGILRTGVLICLVQLTFLTCLVLKLEYSGQPRWPNDDLAPYHQLPWYWLRKIGGSWCSVLIMHLPFISHSSPFMRIKAYFDGLVQDCSNSSAWAMELLQSCTKLLIYSSRWHVNSFLFGNKLMHIIMVFYNVTYLVKKTVFRPMLHPSLLRPYRYKYCPEIITNSDVLI